MSEDQNTTAEDLDVEASEAASVAGGRMSEFDRTQAVEEQLFRLQSAGYIEEACTTEGTRMVNPKTRHTVTVRMT